MAENREMNKPAHLAKEASSKKPRRKKKALRVVLILLAVLFSLAAVAAGVGLRYLRTLRGDDPEAAAEVKEAIKNVVDSTDLMQYAKSLKADLRQAVDCLKAQDVDGAEAAVTAFDKDVAALKAYMDSPLFKVAELTPGVSKELKTADELIVLAEDASAEILWPVLNQLRDHPLSELKVEGGINVGVALSYMDVIEQILPRVKALSERLDGLDLSLIDQDGKIAAYSEQLHTLMDRYETLEAAFPATRAILGNGEDRAYLFAAQCTSETRSSGGFPGAVGLIRIEDGVLRLQDFEKVHNMFVMNTSAKANITQVENRLFGGRMSLSWDADFCPDYERVAYIWSLSYLSRRHETVDGVFSATPPVIQKLLAVSGEIVLSDGSVLNGDNATAMIGHDFYFRYIESKGNEFVDTLFAETAKLTLEKVIDSFSLGNLSDYLAAFRSCIEEKALMFWLEDEQEQALVREAGWANAFNSEDNLHRLGVYFNCSSCKMGWYLDIDASAGNPVVNGDGTKTYDFTVTFANTISEEELRIASSYVLGGRSGDIYGYLYLFSPVGGSFSDVTVSDGKSMASLEYYEREANYLLYESIWPNTPLVITGKVTVAVDAPPLEFLLMPTMSEYR